MHSKIVKYKEIIKKYYSKYYLVRIVVNVLIYILTIPTDFFVLLRRYNIYKSSDFQRIKELKDKYFKERCFIIGTGPSLTIEDLNLIKDEKCFSMNALIDILSEIDWRSYFYGIQDEMGYKKWKKKIINHKNEIKYIFKPLCLKEFDDSNNTIYFSLNFLGHNFFRKNNRIKFSENAYCCVYDGFTITYSLIQIAIYMGFKNIYLLGCDADYVPKDGKIHFIESDD